MSAWHVSDYLARGHWKGPAEPEGNLGFVYIISGHGRFYVGRKFYRPLKGKHKGKENPRWKTYMGSNKSLLHDIIDRGKDGYRFEIIENYPRFHSLAWAEIWTLCHLEALTDPRFYNSSLDKLYGRPKEGITERHKMFCENFRERQR